MPLQQITFPLRGEFITLDRLLKACGLAESGGRAKTMVAEGMVQVDGRDVALVIDGGMGDNVPTTVVDLTGDEPEVLREGKGELQ